MALTYGSLFAGIGGADLGLERAGMQCRWQVEIDPECRRVLARHWPDVERLGDVRTVGAHNLAPVDVIVFGSPCQDLSVAGNRAGMDGAQSGLFFEACRIIRELRPTYAIWENVPGAFSSSSGRDFGRALDALAEAGALDIGWRVLDAQWFGLAQRRKRVFVVADFRAHRAASVLFEPESRGGDSPPRGEAREDVAATTRSRSHGAGVNPPGRGGEDDSNIVLAHALTSHPGGQDATTDTYVTHTLRSAGADASEDGTGRGVPLVVVDAVYNTYEQQGFIHHGDAEESRSREVLLAVRKAVGEEAFQDWALRGLRSIREAEVLRLGLHGQELRRAAGEDQPNIDNSSLALAQARSPRTMLEVLSAERIGCASQERELAGQLIDELGAYLSLLSQPGASQSAALSGMWQAAEGLGLLRQALSEIQDLGRPDEIQEESTQPAGDINRVSQTASQIGVGVSVVRRLTPL